MTNTLPLEKYIAKNIESWIKEIQNTLTRLGSVKFHDLLRHHELSDKQLLAVLEIAMKRGEVIKEEDFYKNNNLTSVKYGKHALNLFNPHYTIDLINDLKELNRRFKEIVQKRPIENRMYEQRPVTLQTSLFRALYLLHRGDLIEKDIVLLGDDDLTSIAICLIGGFSSLTILEIDDKIVDYLEAIFVEFGFQNCKVQVYDANEEIPAELKQNIHTFLCDPTKPLYELFLKRGLEMLKDDGAFYSFINPSHSQEYGEIAFQKKILQSGFMITDVIPFFNEYYRDTTSLPKEYLDFYPKNKDENELIGFTESLIRCRSLKKIDKRFSKFLV